MAGGLKQKKAPVSECEPLEILKFGPRKSSATISWQEARAKEYSIRWWRDGGDINVVKTQVSLFSLNLEPGSSYNVQVATINDEHGEEKCGTYSSVLSFDAGLIAPIAIRADPAVDKSTKPSILVKFVDPEATEFEIFAKSLKDGTTVTIITTSTFAYLENVLPGHYYDIQVCAVSDGIKSKPGRLEEPVLTKPGKVDTIYIKRESANACTITWDEVPGTEQYVVSWNSKGSRMASTKIVGTEYTLGELLYGNEYKIHVHAMNSAGHGPNSAEMAFCTGLFPSQDIKVLNSSFKQILKDEYIERRPKKYGILIKAVEVDHIIEATSEYGMYPLHDLKPGELYMAYMWYIHEKDEMLNSEKVRISFWSIPDKVILVNCQKSSTHSCTITWAAVHGATSYSIKWRRFDGNYQSIVTLDTEYVLTSLVPGKVYYVKVAAVNSGGEGHPSDAVSFITEKMYGDGINFQCEETSSNSQKNYLSNTRHPVIPSLAESTSDDDIDVQWAETSSNSRKNYLPIAPDQVITPSPDSISGVNVFQGPTQ